MHDRVNRSLVAPDRIDEFATALRALVLRALPWSPGLRSPLVLADRGAGKVVIVSRWFIRVGKITYATVPGRGVR